MRIIHADLSAEYTGRGDTILPVYSRVIIIKDDGCILIHGRDGTKPINYMGTTPKITTTITTHGQGMTIRSENTRESLVVTCHTVHSDLTINTPDGDPGIQRQSRLTSRCPSSAFSRQQSSHVTATVTHDVRIISRLHG